jgi:hypothetical protein
MDSIQYKKSLIIYIISEFIEYINYTNIYISIINDVKICVNIAY